jgi:hypothetical protein
MSGGKTFVVNDNLLKKNSTDMSFFTLNNVGKNRLGLRIYFSFDCILFF